MVSNCDDDYDYDCYYAEYFLLFNIVVTKLRLSLLLLLLLVLLILLLLSLLRLFSLYYYSIVAIILITIPNMFIVVINTK